MFEAWKLKKRLDSMENTLQKLTDSFQQLELEWINSYAKFKKIAARIAHDQAVIDSREGHTNPQEAGDGQPTPTGSGLLNAHQREIQQAVLKRRGGV